MSKLDFIGIGIGPFNLGLAALSEGSGLTSMFFDQKNGFTWHEGMLLEGTTLQVPFLADLVTMADASSPFSFLRYLQEQGRLYQFYFLESFHIPRKEYSLYCRWAAEKLPQCRFGTKVENVRHIDGAYEVWVKDLNTGESSVYTARHLVVGIGTKPAVPKAFRENEGGTVFHTSDYLKERTGASSADTVTVLGSGQSAAEVFYDLLKNRRPGTKLRWLTRSKGFFPMEYSKLGLEYFSPDYIDFFYQLPGDQKGRLLEKQDLLYKGISAETISDIYGAIYEETIGGKDPLLSLHAMQELFSMEGAGGNWRLRCRHTVTGEESELESEYVIFGTGYKPAPPAFLKGIDELIDRDHLGQLKISRDYCLQTSETGRNEIFIQNGEIHTHGVGAPDLGLGAYRNAVIINKIAGKEIYPLQERNVFQSFSPQI
ncbi:lysine N(6)-hydroxylase/L-ornithine N(5)-oxygenase family protein [Metabacillus sp. 113a]|uniref:lysine N(6)-hydroxylase/L-ornithine N(5)-oxygenase family protein n=1 Tax=Metabacillus sp. 113a TaxID=3404706 RepID=UPI003CF0D374